MKINISNNNCQSLLLVGKIDPLLLRKNFSVSLQDYFEINEEYTIGKIKELIHFINLKPYNSLKKLAVIISAEKLNLQSLNAILKTLEEPPPHAVIVLTTLNENKILPTILSRCQKIRLDIKTPDDIPLEYLAPPELAKISYAERFKWAENAAESGNVEQIIVLWQNYYREKLLSGKDVLPKLNKLNKAKGLLGSNISVKLLLENLCLEFDGEN